MSDSLHGKKVLITRENKGAQYFSKQVLKYEGIPIEVPLLTISCNDSVKNIEVLKRIDRFDWIFITSANGVECFFKLLNQNDIDFKEIKAKFAVVGQKTGERLREFGMTADFIPTKFDADTLAAEFLASKEKPKHVLLVRGNLSRDVLPIEFTKTEIVYEMMEVYKTDINHDSKDLLIQALESQPDFITFTSPSSVDAFDRLTISKPNAIYVCIGSTTEKRAYELGYQNLISPPEEFTINGMIDCMIDMINKKENE